MSAMIDGLLQFSRVQTQGNQFEETDLNGVYQEAVDNLKVAIEESGGEISAEQLPTLAVDASQIMRLLQNLIGNALKFRGEAAPRIHLGVEQVNGEWQFSVRDNGIGMAEEDLDRIFTIFQRLHTREHYPGSGIGLAVCKRIVERHGGHIWAESKPAEGSTFHFTLPLDSGSPIFAP
jgi:light-regulated signal transduction histidine kinase (bacteriophytochrome)